MFKTGCAALWVSVALVAGCGEKEIILEGDRELILGGDAVVSENRSPAISLPKARKNAAWTHRNGSATHKITHPALSGTPSLMWAATVGEKQSRRHRITADPVAADGRVFAMDALSQVTAVGTDGSVLWTRSLVPASDKIGDAAGGGLAITGDRLVVTTGFGHLAALDVSTGETIWDQKLEAPVTSAPTVKSGVIYAIGRDNRAWAIEADTGRIRWQLAGTPSTTAIVGGAGPAVTDGYAIFPFSSGEIITTFPKGGFELWNATVSGGRDGKAYAGITDISGDPVVVGNRVYAGNASGRIVAFDIGSGNRIWTANEGTTSPVWPTGNSVFVVSDNAELVRLDASTGDRIWGTSLPKFPEEKVRKRDAVFAHYGPVLAGGQLIVASSDGVVRFFDPTSGALRHSIEIPDGAASNPIVMGNTLYIMSANGQLHAFR
jgi:outer membrane protein assembly factor BamB